ncbi:16235_t:CDS:2 [Entrophospora sp. SA101]|nr:16235_t:CDS:2 [Entrophospora sp. SA101]
MEEVLISQDYLDHLQREDDCSTSTTLQRRSGVWEFFDYDKQESKNGHRWATCFKCNMHWSQGRPVELEEHIALYCTTQVKEIIQFYSQIVAKRKGKDQQLLLDDLMDLTNPEFGNEDKDSNSEENDENDDNDTDSNNEDNEFDEDEFGAAFVQSLQNE